jgi:hypothetical protein
MTNTRQIMKLVGIGFGLAAVVFVAVGLALPRGYTITRSVTIAAEPARVHQFTGDLDQWPSWTPWLRTDPTLAITPGALVTGKGAQLSWKSKTGGGELTFTRCQPDWGVAFDMTLGKKKRLSACSLQYNSTDRGTEVVWQLQGDSGLDIFGRYFNLMLDPLMGPMLDEGLQRIKMLAEEPDDET